MGYPTTTFDVYVAGTYHSTYNIIGNAVDQWPQIVEKLSTIVDGVSAINVFNMRGDLVVRVTFT